MLCYCVHFICLFGFLRCAEFTSKSCSVRNNNTVLYTFHLKSSKTDPFYQGVPIVIFCNNVLCRVASMHKFISRRRSQGASNSSPLFLEYDNCVLTRYRFIYQGCDFSAKTRISVFFDARKVILVNRADPV